MVCASFTAWMHCEAHSEANELPLLVKFGVDAGIWKTEHELIRWRQTWQAEETVVACQVLHSYLKNGVNSWSNKIVIHFKPGDHISIRA